MDSNRILKSTYEEILFDGKNKAYGAYILRITYERRMRQALLILMLFLASIVGMSMLPHSNVATKDGNHKLDSITIDLSKVHIIKTEHQQPPAPNKQEHKETAQAAQKKVDQKVGYTIVHNEQFKPVDSVVVDISSPTTGANGDSSGAITSVLVGGTGTNDTKKGDNKGDFGKRDIGEWAEVMPAFNGDLNKYLEDHLNYPEEAKSGSIEGRVVVQFVVNTDGSITDALIVKHLGAGCDEEALRVIKSMPKWKPGKQNGAAIRVLYKQPISFILQ